MRALRAWLQRRGLQFADAVDRVHLALPQVATMALWFVLPGATLGLGTWLFLLFAGYRLRSLWLTSCGWGYLALAVVFLSGGRLFGAQAAMGVTALSFALIWIVGPCHSALVAWGVWWAPRREREYVVVRTAMPATARPVMLVPVPPVALPQVAPPPEPAVVRAQQAVQRRRQARELLLDQPDLAQELRIGRPDLARSYDDGGLVDVNHVPVSALVEALEIPRPTAERVVIERELRNGFTSVDELVVYCGLTADRLAVIRTRIIFLPR